MQVLIDNRDLKTVFSIEVLDYTGAFGFPAERQDEREWADKSGVDRNLANIKYDAKEFMLKCYCKADNEGAAYVLAKALVDYMYSKGVFVLSFRDTVRNIRECFLCQRSGTLVPTIHIREQNSLYVFKIGLKDINPNAVKYKTTISGNSVTVLYEKGQTADIYWGNGDRDIVSNSGNYTKDDYATDGLVDVIIDVDTDAETVSPLQAEFSVNHTSGAKILDVQFTDESLGTVEIWSWDFGDGNTSSEQNPLHSYQESGTYTVTLQIFNSAQGADTETKVNYITVVNSALLINDSGDYLIINDSNDKLLIN